MHIVYICRCLCELYHNVGAKTSTAKAQAAAKYRGNFLSHF